jgi:diaminopimelate decarboxylase
MTSPVLGLLDSHPVLGLIDLDHIDDHAMSADHSAFASDHDVLHAVLHACKAVPLPSLLRLYAEAGSRLRGRQPG